MKSLLIKDTTVSERAQIVREALGADGDYDMDYFSEADKHQYRDKHFEEDKQMAYELGKNIID